MNRIAVVGAGLSGAVVARELADADFRVSVFDARNHVAGNCHTERDPDTGVMVHAYGPHIFHTAHKEAWDYLGRFGEIVPYINRVKAVAQGQIYSFPINLHTIAQFFGGVYSPAQGRALIESLADKSIGEPETFEEQALKFIGRDLFEAFFKGYTIKQWGLHPGQLPASILKRLPVRFNHDDNYYNHPYQGIPKDGYTAVVSRILDHPNIEVVLNHDFKPAECAHYKHCFWSGSLDRFFDYRYGELSYRTLDFESFTLEGDYQGNAVINYCDEEIPYTRITEHKHFAPWETHRLSTCYRETSRICNRRDIPYYPVLLATENRLLLLYRSEAEKSEHVTFIGRLGTYRYMDMDFAIMEALSVARTTQLGLSGAANKQRNRNTSLHK